MSTRSYSSTLRAEQAEQTRERIIQAAIELLNEGDASDLSMEAVAERAGVSVRTAYRKFATREALLDGLFEWVNEHMLASAGLPPATFADYETMTPDVVRVVFELSPLYQALLATPAGRESHRRQRKQRRRAISKTVATELPHLDKAAAQRLGAVVHAMTSATTAIFIRDYWDLDADDVARALSWAIAALYDAARDPKRKEQL